MTDHIADAFAYRVLSFREKLTQPLKELPVSDTALTILAFQIMNGVRVYRVTGYRIDNKAGNPLLIKSREELQPADSIIMSSATGLFVIARVIEEVTDFSYEEAVNFDWCLGKCLNPQIELAEIKRAETEAANRLAQSRAKKAAIEILESSGLSFDEMKLLLEGKAE